MKDIRIRFRKLGRVKYISHLDLTRTMTRAIRRAGLPIWYTEGFNKHPYLTFSAPLSLGFEGLEESMDIRLVEDMPMEELVERLNVVLPQGLDVYAAGEPVMKAGEIAFAHYRITLKGNISLLPAFLAQDSITSEKRSKKGVIKPLDLKPALSGAACTNTQEGVAEIDVTLPCSSTETINPMLIAAAYQTYVSAQTGSDEPIFCDVLRLQLLDKEHKPFA